MIINDSVLQESEKIILSLRQLYMSHGYRAYRMSKFEEYDLYAKNKDFLVSDNVITFNDIGGKLMALKPDVTLSIIKNSTDSPDKKQKVFYNENVYRVSKSTDSFREIMQSGVECFGDVCEGDICEMLTIACESMSILSKNAVLAVSCLDILKNVIDKLNLDREQESLLFAAISEKNIQEAKRITDGCADRESATLLISLVSLSGNAQDVMPKIETLLGEEKENSNFCRIMKKLVSLSDICKINIDFSIIGDVNYYNGIVFKGFLPGIPSAVLSGGQYDRLMKKLGKKALAIGFAVYTDLLERADCLCENADSKQDEYVNIALPKGRLGKTVYDMFEKAGFECPSILETNRKLIFENAEKKVRYFWVKPSDVAIYVERGAADIGVAGKDILLEYEPDVYELLDLKKGKCKMAVAAPKGYIDDESKTLKVATKFSNIAKTYYLKKGRDIDIIHLNGSIEIAPILGLSDVIADIVETGTTLKENNLEVIETILPISARLIANKASYKFKSEQIEKISNALSKITEEE